MKNLLVEIDEVSTKPIGGLFSVEVPYWLMVINIILAIVSMLIIFKTIKNIKNKKILIASITILLIAIILVILSYILSIPSSYHPEEVYKMEMLIKTILCFSVIIQLVMNIYLIYKNKRK